MKSQLGRGTSPSSCFFVYIANFASISADHFSKSSRDGSTSSASVVAAVAVVFAVVAGAVVASVAANAWSGLGACLGVGSGAAFASAGELETGVLVPCCGDKSAASAGDALFVCVNPLVAFEGEE